MASSGFGLGVLVLLCVVTVGYSHQCDVYEQSDSAVVTRCVSLMADLEAALLTENNIYILHNTFFSTIHKPFIALMAEYRMIYKDGKGGLNVNCSATTCRTFGWSSSGLYAVVDPRTIFELETGIFRVTYMNFQDIDSTFLPWIILTMNTSIESGDYSEDEFSFAIEMVTTRVSHLEVMYVRQNKSKSGVYIYSDKEYYMYTYTYVCKSQDCQ